MKKTRDLGRRQFLKTSTLGVVGSCLAAGSFRPSPCQQKDTPGRIQDYRILGRTGFKVSDLCAGSITDEGVLGAALDAGMNYIDTAEQYPGHHGTIAKAMQGRNRGSVFVATKLEVQEDKSKEGFLKRALRALEELRMEYVDCLMMHMPKNVQTLKTLGFHEAMDELKREGRVRFVGVSNHGSFWFRDPEETMDTVLSAAAEDGRFDVVLMAYNFLKRDQAEKVLDLCSRKNIGTAIMKATPVAIYYSLKSRIEDMEKEGKGIHPLYTDGLERYKEKVEAARHFISRYNLQNPEEIRDAAVRFVLGHSRVGTVCCLPRSYTELEGFLRLSGTKLSEGEKAKLEAYREGCGNLYCRHACGRCEPSCPNGVPVNTILRYYHYFAAQGREKEAMQLYAKIPGVRADACRDCAGYCERKCRYGVPAQGMLLLAHHTLSLRA